MSSLTVRLPRLALGLVPSAISLMVISALYFTTEHEPEAFWWFITSFCNTWYSLYYLCRYFQRRAQLKRAALDGGDTWPVAHLLPGKHEREQHLGRGPFVLWFSLSISAWFNLRWYEDKTGIVLIVAFSFSLASSIIAWYQALSVRKAEDKVLCAQSHDMRCKKCGVPKAKFDE
jgi:hypothetical protein